ncbi:MAG: type II toxin-antitoxin system prevent-host-death family antitoxin [Proteobacteria bacterium]|nr:type II toxin-antitoxin system prevent-host-death family antitoxin [Pseudomonadota bacterium]
MRTVNFSDARSNLKAVLDTVVDDHDVTLIKRRDAQDVVVMSLATWNSWKETEYLLASPANARRLRESIAQLDAGKGEVHELMDPATSATGVHESRVAYRKKATVRRPARTTRKGARPRG